MPFDVRDFHDLVRLLEAHPEWRAELRRLILSEELLRLPELVRELAEAQARTEERLGRLEEAVTVLAEAQRGTAETVRQLAEAQRRHYEEFAAYRAETDRRFAELAGAQARTERRLAELIGEVGQLRGRELERRFRERAPAFLGTAGFRRVRVIPTEELAGQLDELEEQGRLSPDERDRLLRTDLIARAVSKTDPERREVWLAVEVSTTVDVADIERAARSAEILGRALGVSARPVAAGVRILPRARVLAEEHNVVLITNGTVEPD